MSRKIKGPEGGSSERRKSNDKKDKTVDGIQQSF